MYFSVYYVTYKFSFDSQASEEDQQVWKGSFSWIEERIELKFSTIGQYSLDAKLSY